ncbi:histidine kinase [Desulfothermobacter acidiphilus]|uniref:sensor histidine kinase n=1 Tax=Desulfothermobacter acidiphilus TaxID=1938353 RepID=UPI003F88F254
MEDGGAKGVVAVPLPELLADIRKELTRLVEERQQELVSLLAEAEEGLGALEQELTAVYREASEHARRLGLLEEERKRARQRLAEISADNNSNETQLREAFLAVDRLQAELSQLREREEVLERRRKELENRLSEQRELREQAVALLDHLHTVGQAVLGEARESVPVAGMSLELLEDLEQEQRQLLREIHGNLVQVMSSVSLRLEYCLRLLDKRPEEVQEELRSLQQFIKSGVEGVRRSAFELCPSVLDMGLLPALRRYLEEFKQAHQLQGEFVVEGREERLTPVQEAVIFRFFREALRNVAERGGAQEVRVYLRFGPDWLKLEVEDDGQGPTLEEGRAAEAGAGIWRAREWARLLGGKLELAAASGQGSRVSLLLPLLKSDTVGH